MCVRLHGFTRTPLGDVPDPVGLLLAATSGRHRRRGLVPYEFLVIEASLDGGLDGLEIRRQIEIPRREETVMAEI